MAKEISFYSGSVIIIGLIVEKGNIDDLEHKVDLKSLVIDKKFIPIIINFNSSDIDSLLGEANLYIENEILKADILIYQNCVYKYVKMKGSVQMYPAISVIRKVGEDGKIESESIGEVSFCTNSRNKDESIQSLQEQLK